MTAWALGVIGWVIIGWGWPGSSAAQSPPAPDGTDSAAVQKAEALFNQGLQLFNQGRFEEACPRFEASLAVIAGIGTRGKLAECWARIGRIASAHRLYLEVARLARQDGDRERAQVARERARRLEPQLSYITIVPGPSAAVVGFTVTRNGLAVEPRRFNRKIPVDPGGYLISATATGHEGWQTRLEVGKAEKKTIIVPALVAIPISGGEVSSRRGGSRLGRVAGLALVGVGTASLLGGTTFFALRARDDWNEARDSTDCDDSGDRLRCDPDTPGDQLADDAASNAQWANITAGVGLLALSTGVYLFLRSGPDDQARPESSVRSLRITPTVSPSSAGVVLWRRF